MGLVVRIDHPSLKFSGFRFLPEEAVIHCLSFLDPQTLGILARACSVFRRITEDNSVWKALHYRQWNITVWAGPLPDNWKNHVRSVREVLRNWPPSPLGSAACTLFWKMGFPNEKIDDPLQLVSNPNNFQMEVWAEYILGLLDQRKIGDALAQYCLLRTTLIEQAPLFGWWISNLISHSLRSTRSPLRMNHQDYIQRPRPIASPALNHFQAFLFDCWRVWVKSGNHAAAYITLECLERSRRKSSHDIENLLREPLFLQITQVHQEQRSENLWTAYGDILLDSFRNVTYPQLRRAAEAYGNALKITPPDAIQARMAIAAKLAEVLVEMDPDPEDNDEFQLACLPVLVFKQSIEARLSFTSLDVSNIVDLVRRYEIDLAYPYILKHIAMGSFYKLSVQNFIGLHFNLIELHRLSHQIEHAVEIWVKLSRFVNQKCPSSPDVPYDPYTEKNLYTVIYELLNESEAACHHILSYREMHHRELIPALAYAFYRLNDEDNAVRTLTAHPVLYLKEDVAWLFALGRKNFTAAIAGSLLMHGEDELENYFTDMLDDHPWHRFFIYHNLAVRLYFSGYPKKALEVVQIALEEQEEPETLELLNMLSPDPARPLELRSSQYQLLILPRAEKYPNVR